MARGTTGPPGSTLPRPPSYVSDFEPLPTTPERTHTRRAESPSPTYDSRRDRSPLRTVAREGRPSSLRFSDFETPILAPSNARRPASTSPGRLFGARSLPNAPLDRSNSPDTSIRIPLLAEKDDWVEESPYEVADRKDIVSQVYSIDSHDDDDNDTISPDPSRIRLQDGHPHDQSEYGPVPLQAQPRRGHLKNKTAQVVKLTQGNLVLERAIPEKLKSLLLRQELAEFTHLRYTAVTGDPDDFVSQGFTLRQQLLGRETELLIIMTMYNEDETLLTRTLHGVIKNVTHLTGRSRSRTWGKDSWQKVVILIVADGRKFSPRVYDVLTALGVYQEGLAQQKGNVPKTRFRDVS